MKNKMIQRRFLIITFVALAWLISFAHVPEAACDTALKFDGVDDYVEIPDDPSLDMGTGSFTLEAWFKSDGPLSQDAYIFIKDLNGQTCYGFRMLIGGALRGGLQYCVTQPTYIFESTWTTYGGDFDDGEWHHFAMVVDRTNNNTQTMYADGIQIGSTTDISYFNRSVDNDGPAYIGTDSRRYTYAKATMDEVRVWKGVARTEQQICKTCTRLCPGRKAGWSAIGSLTRVLV